MIAVTGGAGFLGFHLANYIAEQGERCVMLDIAPFHEEDYPKDTIPLFSGMLHCAHCQEIMTSKRVISEFKTRYNLTTLYACSGYQRRGKSFCRHNTIMAAKLDTYLLKFLKEQLQRRIAQEKLPAAITDKILPGKAVTRFTKPIAPNEQLRLYARNLLAHFVDRISLSFKTIRIGRSVTQKWKQGAIIMAQVTSSHNEPKLSTATSLGQTEYEVIQFGPLDLESAGNQTSEQALKELVSSFP